MGTRQTSLAVNDVDIALDNFVRGFIDQVVGGILAALEGTGEIKTADIAIDEDSVTINLNDAVVPVNPFVTSIIRSTITGMISTLKGVSDTRRIIIKISQ